MPIKVTCSNCGGVLHAPDDSAGKRGRCPSCGTVLTISADAPRVTVSKAEFSLQPPGSDGPTRPVPFPQKANPPSAPDFALPPGPAFPPAPAPGTFKVKDDGPRSPAGMQSSSPAVGPKKFAPPPPPPARPDPFLRTGRSPAAAAGVWTKVRRGLGWVQAGAFFLFVAVVACPGLDVAVRFGAPVPNDDPGYLKVAGFSTLDEIRTASVLVPLVVGLLCVVVGRLGVGAAPAESAARGPGKAAAWGTLFAFLLLLGGGVLTGLAIKEGNLPRFDATVKSVPTKPPANVQRKAEEFVKAAFLPADQTAGQAQRMTAAGAVAFGLAAELWFLAALGRIAAMIQTPRAAGRVNRFLIFGGLLFVLATVGLLAYDLYGTDFVRDTIKPTWDGLDANVQAAALVGGLVLAGFVFLMIYWRMLGSVKRAIRETFEPMAT